MYKGNPICNLETSVLPPHFVFNRMSGFHDVFFGKFLVYSDDNMMTNWQYIYIWQPLGPLLKTKLLAGYM